MSVDLDVDTEWDIDEELDNKAHHFVIARGPGQPGRLLVALCGSLFRTKGGWYPMSDKTRDWCPACEANVPGR